MYLQNLVIFNSSRHVYVSWKMYVLNRTWDMDTQHSERVKFRGWWKRITNRSLFPQQTLTSTIELHFQFDETVLFICYLYSVEDEKFLIIHSIDSFPSNSIISREKLKLKLKFLELLFDIFLIRGKLLCFPEKNSTIVNIIFTLVSSLYRSINNFEFEWNES